MPDTLVCGTTAGRDAHRRLSEPLCAACKLAWNEYQKVCRVRRTERAKTGERSAAETRADLFALGQRRCVTCDQVRTLAEFNSDASKPRGISYRCKSCEASRVRTWQLNHPEQARTGFRNNRWRRRAALKTGSVDLRVIADRDEWLCGICGETVASNAAYPDPRSASLDHVVPLSRGGIHAESNVRVAHWICNVRRGNR